MRLVEAALAEPITCKHVDGSYCKDAWSLKEGFITLERLRYALSKMYIGNLRTHHCLPPPCHRSSVWCHPMTATKYDAVSRRCAILLLVY